MSKAVDAVSVPPPGHGPTIAVYRPPAVERVKMTVAVIVVYGVIEAIYALAAPHIWWIFLLIVAPFAALTVAVQRGDVVAVGEDWLKVSGGRWVETTHLTQIQLDRSHVWKLDLRDSHGRKLTVDRSLLRLSPQVWTALDRAVERSRDDAPTLDTWLLGHPSPGAAASAGRSPVRTRHPTRRLVILAVVILPVAVAALIGSEVHAILGATDGHTLGTAFVVSVAAGVVAYGAWRAWSARANQGQASGASAGVAGWGRQHRTGIASAAVISAVLLHAVHGATELASVASGIVLGGVIVAEIALLVALVLVLARKRLLREKPVGTHFGEVLLDRSLIDAIGDAGLELTKGLDGQERAGVLPDLNDVDERHLVI
jgi:hypothetical protein